MNRTILSCLFVSAVIACSTSDSGTTTPGPSQGIVIGSLNSLTGDLAGQGRDFADATTLIVEEVNAAGGVLGKPLRVEIEDDGTTAAGAKVGFSNLVGKKITGILGPSTSGQATELAELFKASRVPSISATATSPALTSLDDGDYFFRMAPSDVKQAGVIVEELVKKVDAPAIEKMCIVHRIDSYGTELANAVKTRLEAIGVKTVLESYSPEQRDLSSVMTKCNDELRCGAGASDAGADGGGDGGAGCTIGDEKKIGALFLTFVADGAAVLDSANKLGWSAQKQRFFCSDGLRDQGLFSLLQNPQMLDGAIGTAPSGPDQGTPEGERLRALRNRFQSRFGRSANLYIENIYDAGYVLVTAVELAGRGDDPTLVRDTLRKLQDPNGERVATGEWKKIRELIAAKKPINLVGASGSCDFDDKGDTKPPYYYSVWQVKDATISDVRVVELSQ